MCYNLIPWESKTLLYLDYINLMQNKKESFLPKLSVEDFLITGKFPILVCWHSLGLKYYRQKLLVQMQYLKHTTLLNLD